MFIRLFSRVAAILICFTIVLTANCFADAGEVKVQQDELKGACLSATVTAINLEIDRYQQWIDLRKKQGNYRDLLELRASLNLLKADLEKYRNMTIDDYTLPEQASCKAWVQSKAEDNSLLNVEGMTKLGPFYHIAGVVGDHYASLRPNDYYEVTFYKVYPRAYWSMESDYIYIAEISSSTETAKQ